TPCANIEIEVKGGIVNKTPAECCN
ncbi:type IV pili fiber building block protein, partial [Francisella tularensis subsp. holarctica]|nr:type IV pili fiber building block protein [Francisella tularensis subsp. holarctica]